MSYLRQIIITVVVLLLLVVVIRVQITINELNETKKEKQEMHDELQYENEKLKDELSAPMDDEYIAKIAEEELGYKDPNKQYFYNDIPE